jgi:hypothetical protein
MPYDPPRLGGPTSQEMPPWQPEDPPNALPQDIRRPLWGYIDRQGHMRIPVKFEEASPFHESRARVRLNGLYGYIDPSGIFKVEPRFENASDCSEGLCAVFYRS